MSLLQQRMDKCTTEQFWAVASLTTLHGVLLLQHGDLPPGLSAVLVVLASTIATAHGVFFVVHRHRAYYTMRSAQAALLRDYPEAPEFLRSAPAPWKGAALTGVVFYVAWIVGGWLATMFVYCVGSVA